MSRLIKTQIVIGLFFMLLLLACQDSNDKISHNTKQKEIQYNSISHDTIEIISYAYPYEDSIRHNMFSKWESEIFSELYKQPNFGCGGEDEGTCEGIYVIVKFNVDSMGIAQGLILLDNIKCSEPFDEKFKTDLLNSIKNIVFPEYLRKKCYTWHLGGILKC